MTPEEADNAQQWAGMDGATAWHLIFRHADDWNETGEMMNAWLRAGVKAERERICAAIKAEDDHCATGDYMLDSDDCIAVVRGEWQRPDYGSP